MTTRRGIPLRRPVVVSRSVPHPPGFGRHKPNRPPVARNSARWPCQKATMNQRGGSRARRLRATAARAPGSPDMATAWLFGTGLARARGPKVADRAPGDPRALTGSAGSRCSVPSPTQAAADRARPGWVRGGRPCLSTQTPRAARLSQPAAYRAGRRSNATWSRWTTVPPRTSSVRLGSRSSQEHFGRLLPSWPRRVISPHLYAPHDAAVVARGGRCERSAADGAVRRRARRYH